MSKKASPPPLLSICCITYNHEEYIRQCLDGFLMQRVNFPIEIIVHDDASSDSTRKIIRDYARRHPDLIVPIFQDENQYSKGKKIFPSFVLPRARGKYIALCEGDDCWRGSTKLQKQIDFLEHNPDYVMCYHDAKIVDEAGKTIKESKLPAILKKDFSEDELIQGKMVLTLTLCFRNVLKEFPEELSNVYNGDKFVTSLLGNYGKGKYMNDIEPAVYRKHSAAVWSKLDEAHQIFHNGDTRAWLYRYYSRVGKHKYADYFKEAVIEHFRRLITIIGSKRYERYSNIITKVFTDYPDIVRDDYENELKKLSELYFSKNWSVGLECGRISFSVSEPVSRSNDDQVEKGRLNKKEILSCGCKEYLDDDILQVDWIVTRKCNYKCSYCTVHDNINGFFVPLGRMKKAVDRIACLSNRIIRVLLAGGEPTLHPNYLEFIDYLSSTIGNNGKIITQTNLSLSNEFYRKLVGKIKSKIGINAFNTSFHFEHAKKDSYIKNIRYLSENGMEVTVKLCAHPLNMDNIKKIYDELLEIQNEKLKTDLIIIRHNFGSVPDKRYSKKDLEWIKKIYKNNDSKSMFIEFYDPNTSKLTKQEYTPNEIIAEGLNKFKGMMCNAGINMISINANGELDPAVCFRKVVKNKPNIYDDCDALSRLEKHIACPFEACGVPADLKNIKYSKKFETYKNTKKIDFQTNISQNTNEKDAINKFFIKLDQKGWTYKKESYKELVNYADFYNEINSPAISIIVISWRLHCDTLNNLRVLEKQRKQNFEIIFVDNGGKTGEFDELKAYIDTYVRLNENSGAYLARNIGAVFAKAPILLFLEDDGIPESNLVAAHLELFAEYDIIACRGVYSPKTNNPLNSRQGHYYVGDKEYPTFAHVEGNTSYLAESFFKVGGWDDEIRFGGGGLELYFRLLTVEPDIRKQIYSPRPIIYHDYAQNEEHLSGKLEKQKESFKRLRQKYPQWDQVHNDYRKLCGRNDLLIKRGSKSDIVSKPMGTSVKRILFVNHSVAPYETSGTPISTWNHCLGMKAIGKEVGVLFPSHEVNERFKKETTSGVTVYKVPRYDKYQVFIGNIQGQRLNSYLEWVQELIRDFRPDLVHINDYVYMPAEVVRLFHEAGCIVVRNVCNEEELCHWDYPVVGRGLDSRLCSGPESAEKCSNCFLMSRTNDTSAAANQIVHERIKKRRQYIAELYKSAVDGVIFTEANFKAHFGKFIPISEENTRIIPRGFQFDFDRVVVARDARPTVHFAFIGNIMFSKGIDVVLRAFEALSSAERFEMHVYGQMVDAEFEKWINRLRSDYPGKFHYHGVYRKDELAAIARDTDVAIVPSYFDTYNRVVREMLYCGVPVIATDFFGASIIKDGYNGLKVPVGDHRALARCLEQIFDHPALVAKLGEGAIRTPIPRLTDEIEQIDKFYGWLAEKRKSMKAESTREQSAETHTPLVKAIAFYLPQYHPIPENDRWWGKGFTEWTNVAKAKPLYPGHYQPHLPKDLGFYDLRLPEVRDEQARLANEYGIYGFCYYHYWFNGKRLLNRPLDEILSTNKPDFPFCLCWANEHWTRAWDGHQGEILMRQEFSEADDRNHIQWLLKVFQDKRYIRINEKPLMIVYLSTRLPNASRTAEIWREEAEKAGEGLYLCKVESAPYEYGDPRLIGFDACIEFQPDWGNLGPYEKSIDNGHVVFNYETVANRMMKKEIAKYMRYPCVTPMWDNSPRRPQNAVIFNNSTPAAYAKWLGSVVNNIAKYNLDDSIVFINAWNEWGEGNHLEPDLNHERQYLEATQKALFGTDSTDACLHKGLVSIIILTCNQIRYTKECFESIQKFTREPYEIIFVDNGSTDGTKQWLQQIVHANQHCRLIQNSTNLGFSKGSNQGIQAATGEYVLLLNNDVVITEHWLHGLLECFEREDRIGIVGPMTNHISGPQKVPNVDYTSVADLQKFASVFRAKNRYRRIPSRRVVGFCMLFKRRLIDEIGLLDESFGSGNFEDDDLCLRACLAGYRNLIAGDVFIHHYGSRTFVGNNINYSTSLSRNRKVFQDKWRQLDIVKRFGKRLIIQNGIFHAEEYFRKDDLEKATASILEAIKQAPDERLLYIQMAQMLVEKKRFHDALGILASLPEKNSDSRQYALMGYCHEALGNDRSAEGYADQALALVPSSTLALNVKGVLAFKGNDKAAAEAWFRRAIESDPCFGESYTNLGSLKWEAGEQDDALDAFERGFILSPTLDDVATAYHTAIVATKSFDNAERVFREARALHPTHKRLAFLMIALLLQQEKYAFAMSEIEKAMLQFGIDDGILSAGLDVRKRIGVLQIDKSKSKRATLSLCMIVKNEEAHLAKCLMSVKPVVDEMIVVDTGSSDRSKDIAEALGAKVFDFPWTNDFSEARNYSLAQASGDWILVLDADEVISTQDHGLLQKTTKKRPAKHRAYIMVTRNYTNNPGSKGWSANEGRYIEEEVGAGWVPSPKVRLFVNDQRIRFVNPVHELVEPTLTKLGIPIRTCDVPVHHYGRLNQKKLMAKGKEYYRLGIAKIEQTQGDCNALRELAIQASEIGEHEEAVGVWQKVIERQPNDAVAHMNLGFAFLMMRQYAHAAEYSKKAMAIDPELREAALNYAAAEMFAGDIRTAISTLEHLLETHADYPPAMGRLAAAYIVSGQKAEGLRYLEELNSRGFDCAGAWEEQARAFISESKHEAAALLLAAAIEKGLGNGRMSQLMAECRSKIDGSVKLCGPTHPSHSPMRESRESIGMNAGG